MEDGGRKGLREGGWRGAGAKIEIEGTRIDICVRWHT